MTSGDTVQATNGCHYFFKPDHRDGTKVKSQWGLTYEAELALFEAAHEPGRPKIWYLSRVDNKPQVIGTSAEALGNLRPLHIALFLCASPVHGYPADPQRNISDIPRAKIISQWRANGLLSKPEAVRLRTQKRWA